MQRLRTPQRPKRSVRRRFRYIVLSLVSVAGVLIVTRGLTQGQGSLVAPLAQLKQTAGDVHYSKLIPEGDGLQSGIYDPSVAYNADGGTVTLKKRLDT